MNLEQRIDALAELGSFMRAFVSVGKPSVSKKLLDYVQQRNSLLDSVHAQNAWFTPDFVLEAIKAYAQNLTREKLETWLGAYKGLSQYEGQKRVGVIMAGNIPLVGLHDFICVLASGNCFVGKTSSKDAELLKFLARVLVEIQPEFYNFILFEEQQLKNINAVIATGNNNSARYFEYYFGRYPSIIRKNRNSVAVLNGNESDEQLKLLADDIFMYFGLGCRNVSKIFVPSGYNFDRLFRSFEPFAGFYNHNKYANNYDYNRAIYLVNQTVHLDNGFVLLKEDESFSSPIGTIFYEYYISSGSLQQVLESKSTQIQCIVSDQSWFPGSISFGTAQKPALSDYADNVDTIEFLINLK
jgi:hypothetical protein